MLKYLEIKNSLLSIIKNLNEYDKLPSRLVLCRKLDTTRATLDKAINELTREGYLKSEKGSGTYVAHKNVSFSDVNHFWGIIVPNIIEPIYAGLVSGVEKIAQENGISVTLCNSDNKSEKQEQYLARLIKTEVDGIIMVPVICNDVKENSRLYVQLKAANIPFIFCNRTVEGVDAPIVTSNDYYGAYIGTKQLLRAGYKNIAFISKYNYSTSVNRCYGYLSAIMESNIPVNRHNIVMEEPDGDFPIGYSSMKMLLENDPTIDAVFCFNDNLANGVYKAVKEKNLIISDDIGVIGYNNTISLCEQLSPRLSSLSYQNIEIGEMAAKVLIKKIKGEELSSFNAYLMQPEIVARDSCLGPKKN